ncbi:MAG TPA: rRNA maturation RNase YbeY [Defluviitoga sp.]|nr:rRNA maturation RNase YbeY [Defluviitoga sp.]HPZ29336.1 rRNA maturation RNase YbeY [Defluviitoga sp.]
MKINVINDQNIKKVNIKKIKEVVKTVLKQEIGDKDFEINILLTDDNTIKEYNIYRGREEPTDVLSFAYGLDENIIGDIVISVETIDKQSTEFGNTFEEEFFYILIHGVLHVVGYDHETSDQDAIKMFELQENYFKQLIKDSN